MGSEAEQRRASGERKEGEESGEGWQDLGSMGLEDWAGEADVSPSLLSLL